MAQSLTPPAPFPPQNAEQRAQTLDWIQSVSLVYGAWTHFKKLYKTAEAAFALDGSEPEITAALLARLDAVEFSGPQKVGAPLLEGYFADFAVWPEQNLLYAAQNSGGLQIFDVSSPIEPQKVGEVKFSGDMWSPQLRINGRHLIVTAQANIEIYDLEPGEPRFVGRFSPDRNGNARAIVGEILVSAFNGVKTFALPTTQQPNLTTLGEVSGAIFQQLTGGESFAVGQTQSSRQTQLQIVEIGADGLPKLRGNLGGPNFMNLAVSGRTVLGLTYQKLFAYDVSDLDKPQKIGEMALQGAQRLWVHENLAAVYCSHYNHQTGTVQKLVFVDISRPRDLRLIGELNGVEGVNALAFLGDFLWISTYRGVRAFSFSDPARAQEVGQKPKDKTFGYLKRRGRRLLRILSQADGARYFDLAARVLEHKKGQSALDFRSQWIGADILIGAQLDFSKNSNSIFEQKHHGRGRIARTNKFWRRDSTLRAPQIWAKNPEKVREIMDDAPWQVAVLARRILQQKSESAPDFSPAQLEAILWGDWPFAIREAARDAGNRLSQNELSPRAIAALLWASNPKKRREIFAQIQASPAIATNLATLLGQNAPQNGGLSRRGREIALILAARFDLSSPSFSAAGAQNAIPALLNAGEAPLRELGLNFCRRLTPEIALEVVTLLPQIPQNVRAAFVQALCESAKSGQFELEILQKRVRHTDANVRGAVWPLIAKSKTLVPVLRELWTGLFHGLGRVYVRDAAQGWHYDWQISAILTSALESDAALQILGRAGVETYNIPSFNANFWANPPAPAAVFAAYSLFLETETVVETIAKIEDWVWNSWKSAFLRANALHPKKLAAFWTGVRAFLENSKNEAEKSRLQARTFGDVSVAATFAQAASQLAPALLVQLIGAVPDEVWNVWRDALLTTLQTDAARRIEFWDAVRLAGLNAQTQKRLVEDAPIAATFGLLDEVLAFDDPALESLLLTWLQARESSLDAAILIESAIHPLPSLRAWSLQKLESVGVGLAGALKLFESGLPQPMEWAKNWFLAQENAKSAALALCDSPQKAVRAWGREFVAARLKNLVQNGLLQALGENPNTEMQSFVADLLLKNPSDNAAEFDRAVLRGRNRARRAKSLVQTRRTQNAPLDDETVLLELARGKTPRDADFAWTQLAKRALDGQESEVIVVKGVGAI